MLGSDLDESGKPRTIARKIQHIFRQRPLLPRSWHDYPLRQWSAAKLCGVCPRSGSCGGYSLKPAPTSQTILLDSPPEPKNRSQCSRPFFPAGGKCGIGGIVCLALTCVRMLEGGCTAGIDCCCNWRAATARRQASRQNRDRPVPRSNLRAPGPLQCWRSLRPRLCNLR